MFECKRVIWITTKEASLFPFSLVNEASDPSEVPVGHLIFGHYKPESQNWTKEASQAWSLPEVFEDPSPRREPKETSEVSEKSRVKQ